MVEPDGAIADLHALDVQLERHVERLVVSGQLAIDTTLKGENGPRSTAELEEVRCPLMTCCRWPPCSSGSPSSRSAGALFDATIIGFVLLAILELIANAWNAETLADFLRMTGRSTGRLIYYQALSVEQQDSH